MLCTLKINSDVAMLVESRQWAIGVVVGDKDGGFFAARAAGFHGDSQVVQVEAHAMLFGLRLAAEVGISSIEVESDCKSLINLLKLYILPSSYIGLLCEEIREAVLLVGLISIEFIPRKCNGASHKLAQLGFSLILETHWVNYAPAIIQDILLDVSFMGNENYLI